MISPSELQAIAEREKKATPGPWEAWRRGNAPMESGKLVGQSMLKGPPSPYEPRAHAARDMRTVYMRDEDADFVAHARSDIPALLEAVRELTTELAESEHEYERATKRHLANKDSADAMLRSALGPDWSKLWGQPLEALGYVVDEVLSAKASAEDRLAAMTARCDKAIGLLSQLVAEVEDGSIPGCSAQLYEDARALVLRDEPTGGEK